MNMADRRTAGARWTVLAALFGGLAFGGHILAPSPGFPQEEEPKSNRMVCGECPEGYATTGVVSDPKTCKEDDSTLVQCVPLGAKLLALCGECPDEYQTIGKSFLPSRCGTKDNGLMSQCQLK